MAHRASPGRAPTAVAWVLIVGGALLILVWLFGPGAAPEAVRASAEDVLLRQRAAAHFAEDEMTTAREVLSPLVEREHPLVGDLIRAASIDLEPALFEIDRARTLVQRALELDPGNPRVHWALFRLARYDGDDGAQLRHLEEVVRLAPDDYPARLNLANVLYVLDRRDEAEALYRELIEIGSDVGGSWHLSAVYRYIRFLYENRRADEVPPYQAIHDRLSARIKAPSTIEFERGTFGAIEAPVSEEVYPFPPEELDARLPGVRGWTFPTEPATVQRFEGMVGLAVVGLEATPTIAEAQLGRGSQGFTYRLDPPEPRLLLWGPGGLVLARRGAEGTWQEQRLLDEPVPNAAAFDLESDGDLDLACLLDGELVLLENREGRLERRGEALATFSATPRDVEAVDFDHEGDLDLLVVGDFGARLLRNDAAHEPGGGFAEVELTGFADRPASWCLTEDLDDDNDVDLLIGGEGFTHYARNERGGVFADASDELPAPVAGGVEPRVADFDGDGWPDLATGGAEGLLFSGRPSGSWVESTLGPADRPLPLATDLHLPTPDVEAVVDVDGDRVPERVALVEGTLSFRPADPAASPNAVVLALRGDKDNRRGVGAVVEILAGPIYRRVYWRGEPMLVGLHGLERVDVVRVTWPNGVIQNAVDLPADGSYAIEQRAGLSGSCPFLYSWNGETYVFVSDVLGITPLGLPMGPGRLVPPDHDEYVRVRGDQLAPRDGFFELQFTEELREVTYLDRIRLEVVDHPAGTEIFPNERFTFPPFPEPHTHTVRGALAPSAAVDGDGRDWTEELARIDGSHAGSFEPYRGQFLGLTPPTSSSSPSTPSACGRPRSCGCS